jgi:hypothetical protein
MGYEGRLTPEVNMEVYEEVDAKEEEAYEGGGGI